MSAFEKLKQRLEGRTVEQILPSSNDDDGICKFVLDNGDVFNLCATDLGYWITDSGIDGKIYTNIDAFCNDYFYYSRSIEREFDYKPPKSKFIIDKRNNAFIIKAPKNKIFDLDLSKLNEKDRSIFSKKEDYELFKKVIGPYWRNYLKT